MSIGGIQGMGQGLQGVAKARGGDDLKTQQLSQELKQIEEGVKLAAMTGNPQLLAMLQQQLQGMMQAADSSGGQDMGDDRGGGRAQGLEARQKLDEFSQKAEILAQEIQAQLQTVQAQAGNQGAQGSGFQQDQNQAQGRDMRGMYPI